MHALAILASALAASASPLSSRNVMNRLDDGAHEIEHRFQPLLDFDTDGCYYTAAIDRDGNTNPGLSNVIAKSPSSECRDPNRLDNNNLYSRRRCNNGWCAIMYEYYFEKDQTVWGSWGTGHKHDWENIVIFAQGDEVKRVAPSCHAKYDGATNTPRLDGTRAKVVYHKDGGLTHCFRMANEADDGVENHTGQWFLGNLVGWDNWPVKDGQSLRDRVFLAWTSGVAPKFWDHEDVFTKTLRAAAGDGVPGFDPAVDE